MESKTKTKTKTAARIAYGIPDGYSVKNWDEGEVPIVLLGSVFDANSLGKWIYDWTLYCSVLPADVAGDLWLCLIKLAGKMKTAKECVGRIRGVDDSEMVQDFIESGSRLWTNFVDLLVECERSICSAVRKRTSSKAEQYRIIGKIAGVEFVRTMFGRDRQLGEVEQFVNSVSLWNKRFDKNCGPLFTVGNITRRNRSSLRRKCCSTCGSTLVDR
jgi:hypothetical protein